MFPKLNEMRRISVTREPRIEPEFLKSAIEDESQYNEIVLGSQDYGIYGKRPYRKKRIFKTAMHRLRVEREKSGAISSVWLKKTLKNTTGYITQIEWREVWVNNGYIFLRQIAEDPSIPIELWSVFSNRNYFKFCHCCGYIEQVDYLRDRICLNCHFDDNRPPEEDWTVTNLKSNIIPFYCDKKYLELFKTRMLDLFPFNPDPMTINPFLNPIDHDNDKNEKYLVSLGFQDIQWPHPGEPIGVIEKGVYLKSPIPASDTKSIDREYNKILNNRSYFDICYSCGKMKHKGHGGGGTCHSCMEGMGIVF